MHTKRHKVLTLFVNMMCNIHCSYCFQKHVKTIFNPSPLKGVSFSGYDKVCIMGGEPGLNSKEDIQYILDTLSISQKRVLLPTNGLFIEKYYKYFPDFNYCYHITNIENPKFYDIEDITNLVIATSTNLKQIIHLIESNPDKKFSINENFSERLLTNTKVNKDWMKIMRLATVKMNKVKEYPEYECYNKIRLYKIA